MSTMRWADSDSEEEEYLPSQQQHAEVTRSQEHEGAPLDSTGNQQHRQEQQERNATAPLHKHHRKQPQQPHQRGPPNQNNKKSPKGGGGRGDGRGGHRGRPTNNSGGSRYNNRSDWREMAKASSKLPSVDTPVDGGAWMAQRRAKQEQDERERKARIEKEKQQAAEDKRERRKSQLDALKAAMVEIKESSPPAISSLQKAAADKNLGKNDTPVQILTRDKGQKPKSNIGNNRHEPIAKQNKMDSTTPNKANNWSVTIGDNTAKRDEKTTEPKKSWRGAGKLDNEESSVSSHRNKSQRDDGDELSVETNQSRGKTRKNRGRGRGRGGRGSRDHGGGNRNQGADRHGRGRDQGTGRDHGRGGNEGRHGDYGRNALNRDGDETATKSSREGRGGRFGGKGRGRGRINRGGGRGRTGRGRTASNNYEIGKTA